MLRRLLQHILNSTWSYTKLLCNKISFYNELCLKQMREFASMLTNYTNEVWENIFLILKLVGRFIEYLLINFIALYQWFRAGVIDIIINLPTVVYWSASNLVQSPIWYIRSNIQINWWVFCSYVQFKLYGTLHIVKDY